MVCSLSHEGVCGPAYSLINIVKWELMGIYAPAVCQQCEDRICASACPMKAITKSYTTGLFIRDLRKCIGCLNCAISCPFGAVSLNPITNKAQSCDLCDGDPLCVKFCPTGALLYEEQDRLNQKLRDLNEEAFNLNMRRSLKQLDNPLRLRQIRREIARVKTVLNEDKLGIKKLAEEKVTVLSSSSSSRKDTKE